MPETDELVVESTDDSSETVDPIDSTADDVTADWLTRIEIELLAALKAPLSEPTDDSAPEAMTETLVRRDRVEDEPTEIDELMTEKLLDVVAESESICDDSDETWLDTDDDSPGVICA